MHTRNTRLGNSSFRAAAYILLLVLFVFDLVVIFQVYNSSLIFIIIELVTFAAFAFMLAAVHESRAESPGRTAFTAMVVIRLFLMVYHLIPRIADTWIEIWVTLFPYVTILSYAWAILLIISMSLGLKQFESNYRALYFGAACLPLLRIIINRLLNTRADARPKFVSVLFALFELVSMLAILRVLTTTPEAADAQNSATVPPYVQAYYNRPGASAAAGSPSASPRGPSTLPVYPGIKGPRPSVPPAPVAPQPSISTATPVSGTPQSFHSATVAAPRKPISTENADSFGFPSGSLDMPTTTPLSEDPFYQDRTNFSNSSKKPPEGWA